MRQIQPREHALLILALAAAVTVSYGLLRHRRMSDRHEQLLMQTADIEAQMREMQIPSQRPDDPAALRQRIEKLRNERARQRQRVIDLESRFASIEQPGSASAVRLAVSQLIEQCGAVMQAFEPVGQASARPWSTLASADRTAEIAPATEQGGDTPAKAAAAPVTLTDWLQGRPRQQLVVECNYEQLGRLTRGLDQLPWRVVVTEFEVQTTSAPGPRPLRARLVLAY